MSPLERIPDALLQHGTIGLVGALDAEEALRPVAFGDALRELWAGREPAAIDVAVGAEPRAFARRLMRAAGRGGRVVASKGGDCLRYRGPLGACNFFFHSGDPAAFVGQQAGVTVNALLCELPSGAIRDPYGAVPALECGIVELIDPGALHGAGAAAALTVVRCAATDRSLSLSHATRVQIAANAVDIVRADRLRAAAELQRIIESDGHLRGIALLYELGLFEPLATAFLGAGPHILPSDELVRRLAMLDRVAAADPTPHLPLLRHVLLAASHSVGISGAALRAKAAELEAAHEPLYGPFHAFRLAMLAVIYLHGAAELHRAAPEEVCASAAAAFGAWKGRLASLLLFAESRCHAERVPA